MFVWGIFGVICARLWSWTAKEVLAIRRPAWTHKEQMVKFGQWKGCPNDYKNCHSYHCSSKSTVQSEEPVPTSQPGPVHTLVGSSFEAIVKDPTKDVLVEFYAPWCGHCKKLEPVYASVVPCHKDDGFPEMSRFLQRDGSKWSILWTDWTHRDLIGLMSFGCPVAVFIVASFALGDCCFWLILKPKPEAKKLESVPSIVQLGFHTVCFCSHFFYILLQFFVVLWSGSVIADTIDCIWRIPPVAARFSLNSSAWPFTCIHVSNISEYFSPLQNSRFPIKIKICTHSHLHTTSFYMVAVYIYICKIYKFLGSGWRSLLSKHATLTSKMLFFWLVSKTLRSQDCQDWRDGQWCRWRRHWRFSNNKVLEGGQQGQKSRHTSEVRGSRCIVGCCKMLWANWIGLESYVVSGFKRWTIFLSMKEVSWRYACV